MGTVKQKKESFVALKTSLTHYSRVMVYKGKYWKVYKQDIHVIKSSWQEVRDKNNELMYFAIGKLWSSSKALINIHTQTDNIFLYSPFLSFIIFRLALSSLLRVFCLYFFLHFLFFLFLSVCLLSANYRAYNSSPSTFSRSLVFPR